MDDGKVYNVAIKQKQRDKIARQTEEFLKRGGEIDSQECKYRDKITHPREWILNENSDRRRIAEIERNKELLSEYRSHRVGARKAVSIKIYKELRGDPDNKNISKSQLAHTIIGRIVAMHRNARLTLKIPTHRAIMAHLEDW